MKHYIFNQWCKPCDRLRENEIISFLKLMKDIYSISEFYDGNDNIILLEEKYLKLRFEKKLKKMSFPYLGIEDGYGNIPTYEKDENTISFMIHTGTQIGRKVMDYFNIRIGEKVNIPKYSYLKELIGIFKPFESYLEEISNERYLNSHKRFKHIYFFERPIIIRGFHYLDESLSNSIGGIDYCLKAPAWKVERFCDGVLIQLTEDIFDPEIPEHLEIQKEVMKYFSIWDW